MTSRKRRRSLAGILSLAAAGLGYVYSALIQGRSIRSKLQEDRRRIEKIFSRPPSAEARQQQLEARIEAAKDPTLPPAVLAHYNVKTRRFPSGLVYEMGNEYPDQERVLIYFHDGKRVDGVSWAEWKWLDQIVQRLNCRIVIPYLKPLSAASLAEECQRLAQLMVELNDPYGDAEIYFLGSDSGCMFALQVAQRIAREVYVQHLILLSPWLDAGLSEPGLEAARDRDFEQDFAELTAIRALWEESEPLVNLVDMDLTDLPHLSIIGGTCDIHEPATHRFYQRVKEADGHAGYYRFDRMPHSFYLMGTPEADEVIGIIKEILHRSRRRIYSYLNDGQ